MADYQVGWSHTRVRPVEDSGRVLDVPTSLAVAADRHNRWAGSRASLRTKLVVAFVGMVGLLVVLGILGLRVLSDSNDRVEVLGALQLRATAYRQLETEAGQVRLLLGLRAGGGDLAIWLGGTPGSAPGGTTLDFIDQTIATALDRLGQSAEPASLGFVPPPDDEPVLVQVRLDQAALSDVITRIIAFDLAGSPADGLQLQHDEAEPLSREIEKLLSGLASSTLRQTNELIAQNRSAFTSSRDLFFGVAIVSVLVALLLGYVLARTVIAPIRAVQGRVAAIAAGDFSGHVEVPRQDELGSLASNVNRMNDELGRLYRELEAASRHKSEFLANMSHELRTPLTAIIGFSEVLTEEMFGELNPKQREYVEDITSSGRHLLALINDILDLSKVEAGRMELHTGLVSLRDILENGLTMVGERAARNGISLRLDVEMRDEVIEADERKLKQVVFNLVSNAVKFTASGGHVEVVARDDPGGIRFSVADDGVGIAAGDQARIFDTFQQVGNGATGAHEGSGLGLGLARRFVELHGGRIEFESEPGRGSTFTVRLPSRQAVEARS
jgi:signal transduction histidine kinase